MRRTRYMGVTSLLLLLLLLSSAGAKTGSTPYGHVPDEQRLYQAVMTRYDADVRPVADVTLAVMVSISLRLNQIIDLDERKQVLTTNVFVDQTWVDASLAWDPSDYNNLHSIRIPSNKVWLPDTFVFNNADEGSTGFIYGKYVLVQYDGKVTWPVPVKLKSSCKVDISYFPFDDQKCALRVGSWVYSGRWVDFVPADNNSAVDLSAYVNNSEWNLLYVSRQKDMVLHPYSNEPHAHVTYRLYMRRRTFYYLFNVIVPCMMLSVLTMLTFWLPAVSSEKVTLGLSVFLAFSMFMLLIAQEVPPTSESVPLIGVYLCVVMTMTSASVIMAVMVVNLYNRGVKRSRAPRLLRLVMLEWLSIIVRVKNDVRFPASKGTDKDGSRPHSSCQTSAEKSDVRARVANSRPSLVWSSHCHRNSSFECKVDNEDDDDEPVWKLRPMIGVEGPRAMRGNSKRDSLSVASSNGNPCPNVPAECAPLHQASALDRAITSETDAANVSAELVIVEWQRIAIVADRLLFWLFFTTLLVANIMVLVVIPSTKGGNWQRNDDF